MTTTKASPANSVVRFGAVTKPGRLVQVRHRQWVVTDVFSGALSPASNVLLESSDKHSGRVAYDSVKAMKSILPLIDVYVWSSDTKSPSGQLSGAVHAKRAVAKSGLAFITSANLTSAAMERNMELGVLVKDGELPFELRRHLQALISAKVIEKVTEDNDQ